MSKCIVCKKEGAVKMIITDGYMNSGEFDVCPEKCHREIVEKGVAFWQLKKEAKR